MKLPVTRCHWSPTGYAYASAADCGRTGPAACTCRLAPPPGVTLYEGETMALEHELEELVAEALGDVDRMEELRDSRPPEFERMLASAAEKLTASKEA